MEEVACYYIGSLVTDLVMIRVEKESCIEVGYTTIKGEIGSLKILDGKQNAMQLTKIENCLVNHFECPLQNSIRDYMSCRHACNVDDWMGWIMYRV